MLATDRDEGSFGSIRYVGLTGPGSIADKLYLDPNSGVVTCTVNQHGFDREIQPGEARSRVGS